MRVLWLLAATGSLFSLFGAGVRITGKVTDENQVIVAGAKIWIEDRSTLSDHSGGFTFELDRPGDYKISAQREGFFVLRDQPIHLAPGENIITLVLNNQREVLNSVEVSYSPPAINTEETASTQKLVGTEMLGIPYAGSNNLQNALPMLPGITQDSRGGIHLGGGSSDQTLWTLDGFNISDPLTGKFESRLSVDSVRGIEMNSGRYSAESGKGSAGVMQIRTAMGDDRWRPSATNFFPGIESHKGLVLGNWTPRAAIAGPLVRGRAWLADSIDAVYDKHVVEELPEGEDRSSSWRASNLLRSQINLTPSNIFTASWLLNYWNAPRSGLAPLDPMETTVDRRTRQNFFSFKNQTYLGGGALFEVGYAATRGILRERPQGQQAYITTPEGRRGNYFLDALRHSGRDQWLANIFLPSFSAQGSHQLKAGFDFDRITYRQRSDRHPFEFLRADGTLSRLIEYAGNNEVARKNFEAASYLQDRWKPWRRLLVEAGMRVDWDQILRTPAMSPRLSFSLAVPRTENTKVSAGVGLFRDATNLRVMARHLDQYGLSRQFATDGRTVISGPNATIFWLDDRALRVPAYRNFSASLEHLFPWGLHGRFDYLRRRGQDGFTFVPRSVAEPFRSELLALYRVRAFDAVFVLTNQRTDVYDSFEVTLRKTFHRQAEVLGSYTRSRALSNAVVDASVDDPLLVGNNAGRLPWDTPNRFLTWGIFPWKEKYSISYWLEVRNGFPFNVSDEEGRLIGKLNERRFPLFLNLNLHLERKFGAAGQWWAWRAGFNNLTNRLNPTVVNANSSSPNFLRFTGGQHRALVLRIRWLGKK